MRIYFILIYIYIYRLPTDRPHHIAWSSQRYDISMADVEVTCDRSTVVDCRISFSLLSCFLIDRMKDGRFRIRGNGHSVGKNQHPAGIPGPADWNLLEPCNQHGRVGIRVSTTRFFFGLWFSCDCMTHLLFWPRTCAFFSSPDPFIIHRNIIRGLMFSCSF